MVRNGRCQTCGSDARVLLHLAIPKGKEVMSETRQWAPWVQQCLDSAPRPRQVSGARMNAEALWREVARREFVVETVKRRSPAIVAKRPEPDDTNDRRGSEDLPSWMRRVR